jgi:heterodisulfide reductase subunit A
MNAIKVGELIRKQTPEAVVYNIHDRLVFDNPENHTFFEKQKEEGTQFLKTGNLSSLTIQQNNGRIQVSADGVDTVSVDMVILSTGLIPAKGTDALAEKLNVDLDKNGFFKADHSILHATGSTIDGVNIAGCCASPCDASTAITRAQAAAGDALSKLIPGRKINLEVMTTVIDEELCAGCKMCIAVCPYKAISFDAEKNVSVVNEAICRGCGTCAATCPGGAATAKHFTNKQIYAEIGGILHG